MKSENRKTNRRLSKYRNRKLSFRKTDRQTEGKGKIVNPKKLSSRKWRNRFDWRSPRISGAIAGILLCVMLVTGIISAIPNARAEEQAALTPTWQLAKEYIYAGGRMLAIEDYGLNNSTPTPTETPTPTPEETPTPTPEETPTPTPTPTPFQPPQNRINYLELEDGRNFQGDWETKEVMFMVEEFNNSTGYFKIAFSEQDSAYGQYYRGQMVIIDNTNITSLADDTFPSLPNSNDHFDVVTATTSCSAAPDSFYCSVEGYVTPGSGLPFIGYKTNLTYTGNQRNLQNNLSTTYAPLSCDPAGVAAEPGACKGTLPGSGRATFYIR